MSLRFLSFSQFKKSIDAASPFSKVFQDFRKLESTRRLNPYILFAKEEGKGLTLTQTAKKWKNIEANKKLKLKKECLDFKEKAEYSFISNHVSDLVYDSKYDSEWKKLSKAIKANIDDSLDMNNKTNQQFVQQCYLTKQLKNKIQNPYSLWKKINPTGTKAEFEKLGKNEKAEMIKNARINFEKSRENLENKFPDHELPFFLSDLEIIPNFEAKQERKIWRGLMKDMKGLIESEKDEKEIKTKINKIFKNSQLENRKKYGFVAGSEKKPLSGYFLFVQEKRKNKTFERKKASDVVQEIGAQWNKLAENEKLKYNNQAKKSLQIVKIQNAMAVKRAAETKDWIALTVSKPLLVIVS
jgi:hypothetical protein